MVLQPYDCIKCEKNEYLSPLASVLRGEGLGVRGSASVIEIASSDRQFSCRITTPHQWQIVPLTPGPPQSTGARGDESSNQQRTPHSKMQGANGPSKRSSPPTT